MSTFTFSAAVVSNTRAAKPGTPLMPAPCTVSSPSPPRDVVAFTTLPSNTGSPVIVVPGCSGANVFRIRTGMCASIAGSTVRGWITFAPKYESSAASAYETRSSDFALRTMRGSALITPFTSA